MNFSTNAAPEVRRPIRGEEFSPRQLTVGNGSLLRPSMLFRDRQTLSYKPQTKRCRRQDNAKSLPQPFPKITVLKGLNESVATASVGERDGKHRALTRHALDVGLTLVRMHYSSHQTQA